MHTPSSHILMLHSHEHTHTFSNRHSPSSAGCWPVAVLLTSSSGKVGRQKAWATIVTSQQGKSASTLLVEVMQELVASLQWQAHSVLKEPCNLNLCFLERCFGIAEPLETNQIQEMRKVCQQEGVSLVEIL